MITYEQRLNSNFDWALQEGSKHFDKNNAVHKTLRKITQRLDELGIPYAVMGSLAMFFHGFRRFTESVDLLVTPEGLAEIHRRAEALGYVLSPQGKKYLRDAEFGVKVEFLVTGDYPGNAPSKEIAFPNPEKVGVEIDGVRCIQLPRLIELKLVSGIANPRRLKDLGDVQQLIDTLELSEHLANELHPFVQDKYLELWKAVRDNPAEP